MATLISSVSASALNETNAYMTIFDEVSKQHLQLNVAERLWAAWYLYMQNDILATGIMSFILHEVIYFGRCLPWVIIGAIPYFDRYKIQSQKQPTWREQLHCAAIVLLSHVTVELPQIWFFHPMAHALGVRFDEHFPSVWSIALQVAVFFVVEDAWHYAAHRALHYGPLYKNIHKMHHFFSAPFGLAAEYASPIETMVLGLGTVFAPAAWAWVTGDHHMVTTYVWIALRLTQAIDAHSGYDFPWSLRHFLPFWAGAEHHDLHHEKFIGNYASSFRWLDKIFDTEAGAAAHKRRRERKLAKAKKAQ